MIDYKETDLNRQLAYDAHRGTSFSPDIRAQQEIDGYMAEMKAVSARFAPFATPENEPLLRAALEQYRQGYLKRLNARLAAKGRCLSTMITGPSNFNHRRNQKANDTEHRRTTELIEWREKALKRLNRDFNPVAIARRPIRSDEDDAIEQLQAKIDAAQSDQDFMKAANRIVKSKKLSIDDKIAKFAELGVSEVTARKFSEEPNGHGSYGFAPYQLTNNNANIKRMKNRIATLRAEAVRPEAEDRQATIGGAPVTIIENRDENRLQLVFDGKPPAKIRKTLKSNGFRWAPSQDAWQRLLNDNARRTVDYITD
jgi:hypothetical protein